MFTPSREGWQGERFAGLPEAGVVSAWRLDMEETESNGDVLVNSQDPLTPSTFSLYPQSGAPVVLKRAPAVFDASGLVVTRHEAISTDGARIPYVQVGPAGETGDAPVLMTGYGGFGLPREPAYTPGDRQAVAGARRDLRAHPHPRRRRVRHALARSGAPRGQDPVA